MLASKKLTTKLLPTVLALMALLLAACGGGGNGNTPTAANTTPAPQSQQVFRFFGTDSPVTDISTFDPAQTLDSESSNAVQMVFTGLVQFNDNLQAVPQLASSYDKSTDGLTYTFHLRSNLQFSDGTPLTSKDVAYSIDRALSPTINNLTGVALTYLGLIKDAPGRTTGKVKSLVNDSILTPDASTVVIKLSSPAAYFLGALAYPTSYVVEKSVIDKWGLKWTDHLSDNGGQGGAGPFMVQTYNHNTGITMVPNPHYYGPKPKLGKVEFLFYATTQTNYQAYQAGQIDSTIVPSADLASAKNQKGFSLTPLLAIFYLTMNYLSKPFDNVNIRQAFELAINKDVALQATYKGTYIPTCHIVPKGMYGYDPNLTCPGGTSTSGDPAKAMQLLKTGMQQEGYTSVSQIPTIKLTYESGRSDLANLATTFSSEWKRNLGISVDTSVVNFNTLVQQTTNTLNKSVAQGGLQFWGIGWIADYPDPQDWTTLQFGKGSPNNQTNYGQNNGSSATEQQQVQQSLAAADLMQDPTARAQAYNQAEQKLVNDVAWLPYGQELHPLLTKPYVIGIVNNSLGTIPPNDWGNIFIAAH
jgi:oligopeptide transport system substrate-binding protein